MMQHRSDSETTRQQVVQQLRLLTLELDRFVDVFARDHALHRTDLDALGHLWEAEHGGSPMTPTQLSGSLLRSPAATSASLDRLEKAGHVVRRTDPVDRRRTLVTLSDEARTLSMEFFRPLAQRLHDAMEPFDDDEVALFSRFVSVMTRATADLTEEVHRAP